MEKTTDEKSSTAVKKRKNSKGKGNGFEGQIAKKLSAALPINFIRSPGSGARVGGKNFDKLGAMFGAEAMKLFSADVVPINEKEAGCTFRFSVECKSYATTDNFVALAAGTANIFKWFQESVVDAAKTDRKPMLIAHWNRSPNYVFVRPWDMPEVIKPVLKLITNVGDVSESLAVYILEDLLKHPAVWVTTQT
jgi:hypothetical protein